LIIVGVSAFVSFNKSYMFVETVLKATFDFNICSWCDRFVSDVNFQAFIQTICTSIGNWSIWTDSIAANISQFFSSSSCVLKRQVYLLGAANLCIQTLTDSSFCTSSLVVLVVNHHFCRIDYNLPLLPRGHTPTTACSVYFYAIRISRHVSVHNLF
jgi:hypothetical protein